MIRKETNGKGQRKLTSWIDSFVSHTANIESPEIFRKWVAISTIAAVLEQKVWIVTTEPMYPNLYTFLIGAPAVGKSRAISASRRLIEKLTDPYIAPTSVNAASIVDAMKECKRTIVRMPEGALEYNAMMVMVGEFGQFMSKFDDDLIAMLTDLYDVTPYSQRRRGNGGLKIMIEKPILNMLVGSTPSNLMKFMPEGAWDQGFTSRIIFVYSEEKNMVDDFANDEVSDPADLVHDLRLINTLVGRFSVTEEYRNAINNWRAQGENPKPNHPRLVHYCGRRKAHLYRLSMISSIDKGDSLIIAKEDFNQAMAWLLEVEADMKNIFKGVSGASDSSAMDEIHHFIIEQNLKTQKEVPEHLVVRVARERLPAHAVLRVIELMERGGMVTVRKDRFGMRYFTANPSTPS